MRRKSERKNKSSPEKKTAEAPTRRSHRRRRQKSASTSPEREESQHSGHESDEVDSTPNVEPEIVPKQPSNSNSDDEKQEAPVWQVKSAETNPGGEIQKLKICLQRPSSTPERLDRSPRRTRKHRGAASVSQTDDDSCEERGRKSASGDYSRPRRAKLDDDVADSSSEDKTVHVDSSNCDKQSDPKLDEQNSSDSQQVSSTDIDESKTVEEQSVEFSEEAGTSAMDHVDQPDSKDIQNGPESTSQIEENSDKDPVVNTTVDNDEPVKAVTPEKTDVEEPVLESTKSLTPEPAGREPSPVMEKIKSTSPELVTQTEPSDTPDTSEKSTTPEPVGENEKPDVVIQTPEVGTTEAGSLTPKHVQVESPEEERSTTPEIIKKPEPERPIKTTPIQEIQDEVQTSDRSTTPELPKKIETVIEKCKSPETVTQSSMETSNIENNHDIPPVQPETADRSDSSDDEDTTVRSSVVSIVNQAAHVDESMDEQTTFVADPARKRVKVKEAVASIYSTPNRITSDFVREICPDLKILSLDEIHLDDEVRPMEPEEPPRKVRKKPFEDKKVTIQSIKEFTATAPNAMNNPLLANRKISIVGEEANILQRPPSPAKNESSAILYIKNLVRPFTLNQLRELLSRTGTLKENGFWINKIKSECYVQYESQEQAVETRNALHGVHWPVANGRRLDVDFGTEEAMDKARTPVDVKPVKVDVPPVPEVKPKEETVDWREERERERIRREQRGVREWDVGKQGQERTPTPPPKRRPHSPPTRPTSPDRKIRKKEDVPAKLLDDLFRKTKATPCIYWLPLSAEMIVIKEEQRRKHMAEHERRLAEIRRVERMRRAPGRNGPRGGAGRYD